MHMVLADLCAQLDLKDYSTINETVQSEKSGEQDVFRATMNQFSESATPSTKSFHIFVLHTD